VVNDLADLLDGHSDGASSASRTITASQRARLEREATHDMKDVATERRGQAGGVGTSHGV
jgi:hypothetical protein